MRIPIEQWGFWLNDGKRSLERNWSFSQVQGGESEGGECFRKVRWGEVKCRFRESGVQNAGFRGEIRVDLGNYNMKIRASRSHYGLKVVQIAQKTKALRGYLLFSFQNTRFRGNSVFCAVSSINWDLHRSMQSSLRGLSTGC